jgi:hypothetical protein
MSGEQNFAEVTAEYEAWRSTRIPVVESDLEIKHTKMAQSPFVMLRGTFYRFLQQFELQLPEVAKAPTVVAVGDLHIENFGTWRDGAGRLAWGINDTDEIDIMPYTIDLVRLATSALLAAEADHLAIAPNDACDAILEGWRARVEHALPTTFVLGERHAHLLRLASEAFEAPLKFARAIEALPAYDGELPKPAAKMLEEVVPWPGFHPELRSRVAGVGSLGSRRIVAYGDLGGGLLVREAKQVPGPATMWLSPKRKPKRGLPDLVANSRGVSADPARRQTAKWVMRPLAPDAARLDLASLKRKHDEAAFLADMGAEAANIHLVSHSDGASPKQLRKDAEKREAGWLLAAARKMAQVTKADHKAWAATMGNQAARPAPATKASPAPAASA